MRCRGRQDIARWTLILFKVKHARDKLQSYMSTLLPKQTGMSLDTTSPFFNVTGQALSQFSEGSKRYHTSKASMTAHSFSRYFIQRNLS